MFEHEVIQAAMEHAVAEYPRESCGLVAGDAYVPCVNTAEIPERDFLIGADAYLAHKDRLQAVIHSHTNGRDCPTAEDMRSQMASAVPWGIVLCDGVSARAPFWFGDQVEPQPLEGRVFRPGVTDCYALVRDWYRLERGVTLPDFPRDDLWWASGEQRLLEDHFRDAGFQEIDRVSEPGDCVMGRIGGSVVNHCGVYVGDGLVLHHLSRRLSRVEPLGPWLRFVTHHLRHAGRGRRRRASRRVG